MTAKAPKKNVWLSDKVARGGRNVQAPAAHYPRAGTALIEHNVPLSAITANQTPLTNVSNNRHAKKALTELWASGCTTPASPSGLTGGGEATGDPRGPVSRLATPPAARFFAVFLAIV